MFTYQITIEYLEQILSDGKFKKTVKTVQEIRKTFYLTFLKEKIKVIGSGRTDN